VWESGRGKQTVLYCPSLFVCSTVLWNIAEPQLLKALVGFDHAHERLSS
jgi:hypothetical protein